VKLFDQAETTGDLDKPLRTAGFDRKDKQVHAIRKPISRYYAGLTIGEFRPLCRPLSLQIRSSG